MDQSGQESYNAVFNANAAVTEAIAELIRARYQNYRVRLVSPDGAWRHAREDAEQFLDGAVSEAFNVAYRRVEELA